MKKLAVLLLASTILAAPPAHAQLAVADLLSEIGITKGTVETIKNGITELQSLQTLGQQLQWLTTLTTSLVHDPNLGTIMSVANLLGLDSDIPINLYAVQSMVNGYGGAGGINALVGKLGLLGSVVNTTYGRDNLYTCTNNSFACQQTNNNMTGLAGSKGMVGVMVTNLQSHLTVLKELQARAGASDNLKDTEDANAQIAAQAAYFTGQSAQIQGIAALNQMQQQVSSEQAKQAWMKSLDTFNTAAQ